MIYREALEIVRKIQAAWNQDEAVETLQTAINDAEIEAYYQGKEDYE